MNALEEVSVTHARLKNILMMIVTIQEVNHNESLVCTICDRPYLSFAEFISCLRTHSKRTSKKYSANKTAHTIEYNVCKMNFKSNGSLKSNFNIHKDQNLSTDLGGLIGYAIYVGVLSKHCVV